MNHPTTRRLRVWILSSLFAVSIGTMDATSITTVPYWNGSGYVGPYLGQRTPNDGAVPTWGQTFTVPTDSPYLTTFDIWMDGLTPDPLIFNGYVMEWNGSRASGPVLSQSGPIAVTLGWSLVSFTPNVTLTPGQQYVFIFSTANYPDGLDREARLSSIATDANGDPFDAYTGGSLVYSHGADPAFWSSQDWAANVTWDSAFRAEFSSSTTVAVPDSPQLSVLALGAGFLAFAGIRRKWLSREF